ncbi:MAG TPA: hypothetical protein VJ577_16650 [Burkholderiaceae bacterium]|nr:hypothetical protein [Burkholderiaceae bacterium]
MTENERKQIEREMRAKGCNESAISSALREKIKPELRDISNRAVDLKKRIGTIKGAIAALELRLVQADADQLHAARELNAAVDKKVDDIEDGSDAVIEEKKSAYVARGEARTEIIKQLTRLTEESMPLLIELTNATRESAYLIGQFCSA